MPQVSKPEDLQEVGSKIRFLRKEKKMSQLELAEAIGVTQNTIYLIETGQSETVMSLMGKPVRLT